jgi:predicted nucleotidyltransferase
MDNRETIISKVRIYKKLVENSFPIKVNQVYLFGSFAKDNQYKDRDIDVALIADNLDNNYNILETEPILWNLRENVDFRIEPHINISHLPSFITEIKNS